jgi:hypothetical protein
VPVDLKNKFELKMLSIALVFVFAYGTLSIGNTVSSWSCGYSSDPNHIPYGTIDWMAEHAMNYLPSNESYWLRQNKNVFLYGTEAPEYSNVSYRGRMGYGDIEKHHNYYNGTFDQDCIDNSSSVRALEEYQKALACLLNGSYDLAAWYAGAMSHYIADLASWAHVISDPIPSHASNFEAQVNDATDNYNKSVFSPKFTARGLELIDPYGASLALGLGVYSGGGYWHRQTWLMASGLNNAFQDSWQNVSDWFGEYFALSEMYIQAGITTLTDVLHSLTIQGAAVESTSGLQPEQAALILSIALGTLAVLGVVSVAYFAGYHKRQQRPVSP